jgi:hypothetical protein
MHRSQRHVNDYRFVECIEADIEESEHQKL